MQNQQLPQFQAELFRPPYAFSRDRPSISSVSDGSAPFGGSLTVGYGGTVTGAALLAPGAPTHQVRATTSTPSAPISPAGHEQAGLPPPTSLLFVSTVSHLKPCTSYFRHLPLLAHT